MLPPYGPDDFKSLIPASNASFCSKMLGLPGRLAVYIYRWISWAVNSDLTATNDLKSWLGLDTSEDLAAPTNVTATDGTSATQVSVSWTASSGASFYKIYRSLGSTFSGATLLGTSVSTSYADTSATVDQVYYYWVVATNASGDSSESTPDTGFAQSGGANSISFASSTTWTVPVSVTSISVEMWAGGGGGGGRGSAPWGVPGTYYPGGGGGGGSSVTCDIAVTAGDVITVTIPSAASGGGERSSGSNAGIVALSRSTTTLVTANGGSGGGYSELGVGSGGAAGTGGNDGIATSIVRLPGLAGSAGSGATGGAGGATDPVETGYGTGGAGADTSSANGSSGLGGKVIISW